MKPTIEPYTQTAVPNANAMRVHVGMLTLWFSYRQLVAFRVGDENQPIVQRNVGGRVTEKHLDAIDGGSKGALAARLGVAEFDCAWDAIVEEAMEEFEQQLAESHRSAARKGVIA